MFLNISSTTRTTEPSPESLLLSDPGNILSPVQSSCAQGRPLGKFPHDILYLSCGPIERLLSALHGWRGVRKVHLDLDHLHIAEAWALSTLAIHIANTSRTWRGPLVAPRVFQEVLLITRVPLIHLGWGASLITCPCILPFIVRHFFLMKIIAVFPPLSPSQGYIPFGQLPWLSCGVKLFS